MNIIQATIDDTNLLSVIISNANKDVAIKFGLNEQNAPKHPSFCNEDWITSDFNRGEIYFISQTQGISTGCVAFEQPDPKTAYLNRLAVLPEYRHNGIGAALVKHIINISRSKKIETISIGIIARHTMLKTWYSDLGFNEVSTKIVDHLPFDVTFMNYST